MASTKPKQKILSPTIVWAKQTIWGLDLGYRTQFTSVLIGKLSS